MLIASPSLVDIAYKSLRSVFDTMGKKAYNYTFYKDSCLVMFTIFILYHYQKALPVWDLTLNNNIQLSAVTWHFFEFELHACHILNKQSTPSIQA